MFVFKPNRISASDLAARMLKAGHREVAVVDGCVHMTPFEHDGGFFVWAESMQKHFDCTLIEIV